MTQGHGLNQCPLRVERTEGAATELLSISLGKGSTAIPILPQSNVVARCNGGTLSPPSRNRYDSLT